jgi:hypothetical protein
MHTGAARETTAKSFSEIMPSWACDRMRLDPYRLPHRLTLEQYATTWTIDRQGAVMKAMLGSGLPVSIALPAKSFKGVAARALEQADGSVTVTLELHHHDPALCVPLLVADNLEDVAADWHSWCRLMSLPMLIVGDGGKASPVRARLGELMVDPCFDRRKRFGSLKHRPWFLRRRKPGVIGPVVRITGEEIIARN